MTVFFVVSVELNTDFNLDGLTFGRWGENGVLECFANASDSHEIALDSREIALEESSKGLEINSEAFAIASKPHKTQ